MCNDPLNWYNANRQSWGHQHLNPECEKQRTPDRKNSRRDGRRRLYRQNSHSRLVTRQLSKWRRYRCFV